MNRMLRMAVLAAVALMAARTALADSFNITVDTSGLSGTQELAFLFTDGDGVVNNAATLSGFTFGGGTPVGTPDFLGTTGVSGDLSSSVALDDSSLSTAIFTQQFTAGSSVSFLLDVTNNFAGVSPDTFAIEVCDTTFTTCYSDDSGTAAMLVLSLTAGTLFPDEFTLNGASNQHLAAPIVTPVATTPEPATVLLFVSGLGALGALARPRRRTAVVA